METGSNPSSLAAAYPLVRKPLPSSWNPKDRGSYVGLCKNNLSAHYKGPGKSQKDATAVRANQPIPVACGLYYYEVKITSRGSEGYFSIGIGTRHAALDKLPGWERSSYGFHTDDGNVFHTNEPRKEGGVYGSKVVAGDVVGCGVDLVERNCFFTVNGSSCGVAFVDLPNPDEDRLYPMIGFCMPNEAVEVNFGEREFVFNIAEMRNNRKSEMLSVVSRFKITEGFPSAVSGMQAMLLSYLVTHGYLETARSLAQSTARNLQEDAAFAQNRGEILQLVLSGEISSALLAIDTSYPDLLEKNPELRFRLHCQQFLEMVKEVDDGEAHITVAPYRSREASSELSLDLTSEESGGVPNVTNGHSSSAGNDVDGDDVRSASPQKDSSPSATNGDRDDSGCGSAQNEAMDIDGEEDSARDSAMEERMEEGKEQQQLEQHSKVSSLPSSPAAPTNGHVVCKESNGLKSDVSEEESIKRLLDFGLRLQQQHDELLANQVTAALASSMQDFLRDVFSLVAYADISASPKQYLLEQKLREELSLLTNSAILESHGCLPLSSLEMMVYHSRYCVQRVADKGLAPVTLLSVRDMCS